MKKYLFLMLLLFVGAFATTAFTSCSSDDDDSKIQDLSIVGTWKDQSRTKDAVWTFNKDGKGYCEENMSAISYKIAFTFTFDGNTLAISSKGNGKTYNQAYKVIINKVNLIKATGENGETLSLEKIK